jgi:hypothetical protein
MSSLRNVAQRAMHNITLLRSLVDVSDDSKKLKLILKQYNLHLKKGDLDNLKKVLKREKISITARQLVKIFDGLTGHSLAKVPYGNEPVWKTGPR